MDGRTINRKAQALRKQVLVDSAPHFVFCPVPQACLKRECRSIWTLSMRMNTGGLTSFSKAWVWPTLCFLWSEFLHYSEAGSFGSLSVQTLLIFSLFLQETKWNFFPRSNATIVAWGQRGGVVVRHWRLSARKFLVWISDGAFLGGVCTLSPSFLVLSPTDQKDEIERRF